MGTRGRLERRETKAGEKTRVTLNKSDSKFWLMQQEGWSCRQLSARDSRWSRLCVHVQCEMPVEHPSRDEDQTVGRHGFLV